MRRAIRTILVLYAYTYINGWYFNEQSMCWPEYSTGATICTWVIA